MRTVLDDANATAARATLGAGDTSKVGTPVNNQIAVWTGDGTIEGTNLLVFNGTSLGIGTESPSQAIDLIGSLELEATTSSTTGVIYKGATRFIHNYGTENLFFGLGAGNFTTTGTGGNTALGNYALQVLTTGVSNVILGNCGASITEGGYNTSIGGVSSYSLTTGSYQVAIGHQSLYTNVSSNFNVGVGYGTLQTSTAANNTAIGGYAGLTQTTGTNNTFVGYSAGYNASQKVDATNSTAIGNGAYTTASNQVVIGNTSVTETRLRGITKVIGGTQYQNLLVTDVETDATSKAAGLVSMHYTTAEEPVGMIVAANLNGTSYVDIGGGQGGVNAATNIRFFTAANSTTTVGTERLSINSSGAVDVVGNFTAGTIQADNGVSGTLVMDDGSTERVTLVFTGGILTSRTVAASSALLIDWTD